MMRTIVITISLATAAAVAVAPVAWAQGAKTEAKPYTQAFLKKAAEEQEAQISLGQLAAQQAKNDRVKQFGEEMLVAHRKLSFELRELAPPRGVQLPSELDDEHKRIRKELSQLSGHAFDREYLQYILRDHQNHVNEFEESMQTVEDPEVLRWAHKTLAMLRAHIEQARWTKMVLHAID